MISKLELINNNSSLLINSSLVSINKAEMKNGQVLWPVRCALSWEEFSLWALELVYILGLEKSIYRIKNTLNSLK